MTRRETEVTQVTSADNFIEIAFLLLLSFFRLTLSTDASDCKTRATSKCSEKWKWRKRNAQARDCVDKWRGREEKEEEEKKEV